MHIAVPVPHQVVEEFYAAYTKRDFKAIERHLDDDVEWSVVGPVDIIHFCGQRRGKTAVMDFFRRLVRQVLDITDFEVAELLIDGDRSATFGRLWAVYRPSGRRISYRLSHLAHYRAHKVVRFCSMIDGFDAAEQMLGHPIDVHREADISARWSGDLVAL